MVKTLTDFVEAVSEFCKEWGVYESTTFPWFRGQSDYQWSLMPSLYRCSIDPILEREITRDFKLLSPNYLNKEPACDLEWLFIMQHYGLPTRLMDWTEGSLNALFFAVSDYEKAHNAAVWILDPWSLNDVSIKQESIPIADHPDLRAYELIQNHRIIEREVTAELPVAVRSNRATPRIIAQRGQFTIHGSIREGLDSIVKSNGFNDVRLGKIKIDGKCKKSLFRELYLSGVSNSKLFPELNGLSLEIRHRYSESFFEIP